MAQTLSKVHALYGVLFEFYLYLSGRLGLHWLAVIYLVSGGTSNVSILLQYINRMWANSSKFLSKMQETQSVL